MGKKVLSCLLCVIFLITAVPITAEAEESTYYAISIDAGNGVQSEKAIIKDDEIYIAATSFSKYTRFDFDEATQTFLIKGQEADKAFKKIIINAETKKAAVGTKLIELENSFVVDGIVYLPFCQMLPILNADIIEVVSGVIYVVNNELSMAELLYDFDINDYLFNISEEFFGRTDLLYWYIAPSYLFDTVVNFRFDRLDIIFDSGKSQDYQTILIGYLKDDELFHKAKSENDFVGNLLESITGLTGISDTFNDVYDWAEKVAKLEIEEDLQEYFEFEELELFIKKGYADGAFDDELSELLGVVHDDMITNDILQDAIPGGTSFADVLEAVDYIYSLLNQVDDHRKMLDAVYNITGNQVTSELVPGASSPYFAYDLEYAAAAQVYELYSGDIVPAYTKKVTEEIVKRLFEDRTLYNAFGVYKLTAGLSGEILELYLPGDSGDRALLSHHSDIANTAMRKAAVPTLDTEESTDEYRLSLLLTLLASKACYDIMAETASGYGQDDGYYQRKIDEIEKMIMGLYLVAENVAFDTYENYERFAEDNTEKILLSGMLDTFEPVNIKEIDKELNNEGSSEKLDIYSTYLCSVLATVGTDTFLNINDLSDVEISQYVAWMVDIPYVTFETANYIPYEQEDSYYVVDKSVFKNAAAAIFGKTLSDETIELSIDQFSVFAGITESAYQIQSYNGRGGYSEVMINQATVNNQQLTVDYDLYLYRTAESSRQRQPTNIVSNTAVFVATGRSDYPYQLKSVEQIGISADFTTEIQAKYGMASSQEFISCIGSKFQTYPDVVGGYLTETSVDLDFDGKKERLVLLSDSESWSVQLQVYCEKNGKYELSCQSRITTIDYCNQQNISLFYNKAAGGYLIFVDESTYGASTGNDAKYATIFEVDCMQINVVGGDSEDEFRLHEGDILGELHAFGVPYAKNCAEINRITPESRYEELLEIRHKYYNTDPLGGYAGVEHSLQLLTPETQE